MDPILRHPKKGLGVRLEPKRAGVRLEPPHLPLLVVGELAAEVDLPAAAAHLPLGGTVPSGHTRRPEAEAGTWTRRVGPKRVRPAGWLA